jgi:quercetin dioxygenase-like cupin family protein
MLRMTTPWACALAAMLIGAACGGSAAPSPSPATRAPSSAAASASAASKAADAIGFMSTKLADGPLPVLPPLPLYINVLDVPQPPAASTQHAHLAGFVYGVAGVHRYVLQGGATIDSQPGEGVFVAQDAVHTHSNPGSTPNQWYFIALRNTNARSAAMPFPGGSILYESADLSANAVPAGKYVEQLNVVTLEKGGRTASHKHGGVELLIVLDGTVQLRVAGQPTQMLTKGKGAVVPPSTILQATNAGDGQAKLLAFFVTAEGAEFSTNVDALP